jgi:hypothetical protein
MARKITRWFKFIAWRTTTSEEVDRQDKAQKEVLNFAIGQREETKYFFIMKGIY